MTNIILPELGDGITSAVVACWHVKEGDRLKAGDEILEVVTDKAAFCVEAPADGTLRSISVPSGVVGRVGETLGIIEPL